MTGLAPRADEVVRDAVDAFMEGRRSVEHDGETLLETKNSRYHVRRGVLFSASDSSLHGSEFVGWLCDSERRLAIETSFQPGLRAVFVDRARGRHIIVTSTILAVSGARLHSVERVNEPSAPYALQRRLSPVPPITSATRPPPPPPRRAASASPTASSPFASGRAQIPTSPRLPGRIPALGPPPARPLPVPSPPPRRGVTPLPPPAAEIDPLSTAPDTLPRIEAPEPLPSDASWPRIPFAAAPAPREEPALLASSDVLDAVDPADANDTDEDIDDVERTEPTSPPFLLQRPATAPPPPASQPGNEPFLLGRPTQRNAPLR